MGGIGEGEEGGGWNTSAKKRAIEGGRTDMKANSSIDIADSTKIHAGACLTTSHASAAIRTAPSITIAAIA